MPRPRPGRASEADKYAPETCSGTTTEHLLLVLNRVCFLRGARLNAVVVLPTGEMSAPSSRRALG